MYAVRSTSAKEKKLTSPPSRRSFAKRSPSTVLASRNLRRKRSPEEMPRAVRRGSPGRHHHALSGNGGQKVYLVPSLDLIVVLTGSSFNVESPVNEMMVRVAAARAD